MMRTRGAADDADTAAMPERREQAEVLRPQAPAGVEHGAPARDVLAAAADVLAGRDRQRDLDLPRRFARVLGGHHGVGAGGHRRAGHDAHRRRRRGTAPSNGWPGNARPMHREGERVVVARADVSAPRSA